MEYGARDAGDSERHRSRIAVVAVKCIKQVKISRPYRDASPACLMGA